MAEQAMATKYGQIQTERNEMPLEPGTQALLEKVRSDRHNAQLWFELSKAYKEQGLCREAVEAMATSISLEPFNGQAYRFKGHYNINIGRFDEAAADLIMASRLIPEDWAVWYHLGIATYLLQDYRRADWAFGECLRLSKTFEDVVDAVNWLWMIRMYLGEPERAAEVLKQVPPNRPCDEHEYYNRCMVFGGFADPEQMLEHSYTLNEFLGVNEAYGVAVHYELTGNMARADELFDMLEPRCDAMWSGFAQHAIRLRQQRRRGEPA